MRFVFISDEFYHLGSKGGAETCNDELINKLKEKGHEVIPELSFFISPNEIDMYAGSIFIVGNFLALSEVSKERLAKEKYFIYEHDHKYLLTRDPSPFENHLAPEDQIINRNFYKNSHFIVAQSSNHSNIIRKNLNLENIMVGMNMWSKDHLQNLKDFVNFDKKFEYDAVIMEHIYPQKNFAGAKLFCRQEALTHLVIPYGTDHREYCQMLAQGEHLVFFPQVLETLSRVCVEANCLNVDLICNENISYMKEDWSSLRGLELISYIEKRMEQTVEIFES